MGRIGSHAVFILVLSQLKAPNQTYFFNIKLRGIVFSFSVFRKYVPWFWHSITCLILQRFHIFLVPKFTNLSALIPGQKDWERKNRNNPSSHPCDYQRTLVRQRALNSHLNWQGVDRPFYRAKIPGCFPSVIRHVPLYVPRVPFRLAALDVRWTNIGPSSKMETITGSWQRQCLFGEVDQASSAC